MTDATADTYAFIDAALRRRGQPIAAADLWVAARATLHGVALLTLDEHFVVVDGLRSGSTSLASFLS